VSEYYRKLIYWALMLLHDKAESVWHWAWYASRKYSGEPKSLYVGGEYSFRIVPVQSQTYGFTSKDGIIKLSE
jgi:hypothetical protein